MSQDLIWAIGLVILALLLAAIEFMLPTGGLLGIGSVIAVAGALFLAFSDSILAGVMMTIMMLILFPALFAVGVRLWPYTPIGRRMLNLPPADELARGRTADKASETLREMIGQVGVAKTDLLPGGIAEIGGKKWDVVVRGPAVDRGQFVEVINVEAGRIRVRATERRPATVEPPRESDNSTSLENTPLEELDFEDLGDPLS